VPLSQLEKEREDSFLKSEWLYEFDPAKRDTSFCYFKNRGSIPPCILGKTKPTVLELFAGVGGMSLAFKNAGMETRWAVEQDQNAAATLGANFKNDRIEIYTDIITDFLKGLETGDRAYPILGEVDHVHASPPCEKAGSSDGEEEKSKKFYFSEFIKAIRLLQPKTATYINVTDILLKQNRQYLQSLVSDLLNIDYQVRVTVLESHSYGDPKDLSMVILWAAKSSMKLPVVPEMTHGDNLLPIKTIRDSIGCLEQYNDKLDKKCSIYMNGIIDHNNSSTKASLVSTGSQMLDADSLQHKNSALSQVHYNGKRLLTVREAACLRSFPWEFRFFGSVDEKLRRVRNTLPIMMATKVARSVARVYGLP